MVDACVRTVLNLWCPIKSEALTDLLSDSVILSCLSVVTLKWSV